MFRQQLGFCGIGGGETGIVEILGGRVRKPVLRSRDGCFGIVHRAVLELQVARQLRSLGYTTARDIIRRDYAQSLEYAKKMNIRCMLVIGDDRETHRAVRSSDGCTIPIEKGMVARPGLMNYIEESQGEN